MTDRRRDNKKKEEEVKLVPEVYIGIRDNTPIVLEIYPVDRMSVRNGASLDLYLELLFHDLISGDEKHTSLTKLSELQSFDDMSDFIVEILFSNLDNNVRHYFDNDNVNLVINHESILMPIIANLVRNFI